jgi:hypothetical protein
MPVRPPLDLVRIGDLWQPNEVTKKLFQNKRDKKNNRSLKVLFAIVLLSPWICVADIIPSALFTDHMVIQRDTKAPVWGTADVGEEVSVSTSWGETVAGITSQRR